MAFLLTMPSLSPTMESGVISSWSKKVGDFIDVGEVLAEIETDKAVMEFEMVDEGYIRVFLAQVGQELAVGTPIAILAESMDEDISELEARAKSGNGGSPPAAPEAAPSPETTPAPSPAPDPPAAAAMAPAVSAPAAAPEKMPPPPPPPSAAAAASSNGGDGVVSGGERIRISPYARKLARERQIDPAALQGSGPGGRIVARDVESAASGGAEASAVAPAAAALPAGIGIAPGGPAYEDLPLTMMRKTIARKMAESKASVPHFQLTRKIRAEPLLEGRETLKAQFPDFRITVNDIIVKACATALRLHPTVNSQFLGDRVRRFNTVDVAVAVGTADGLITPVVRSAELKGLVAISQEIKALAAKAKDRKLAPEDYTGGTFTVSNLGMYGVTEFNAIINTPQACILAVSGVVEEPVVENGELAVGRTMNMTLSSDHRVVDGLAAAQFMETLARMLENPLAMLL
ncbi:MAG: pyruvate dehydrogenase complex dihydrolipoamide acetyltransferase [bacterium]